MNKKYFFIIITFLLIESFFISNINSNSVIIGVKDNNLYDLVQTDTNVVNKSTLYTDNQCCFFSTNNSSPTFEYIIITSRDFENSSFQTLISHKSQYMNARIVAVEDILLNSSFWVNGTYGDATNNSNGNPYIKNGEEVTANYERFNDNASKIRNFIRFAHQNWKTEYVLLGGDVQIIPVRKFYVNISGWEAGFLFDRSIQGWIPSDLYYGNLDGTWNADFDENFGERGTTSTKDEADLYSEVFIGRASIDNNCDIATFVKKVINFETTIKPKDILLHQSNMTVNKGPDTSVIPDACANLIPDSYTIHKLYQKDGIIDKKKWVESFKEPDKLIHLQIGNGDYFGPTLSGYQLFLNEEQLEIFTNYDIGRLDNKFYPIHISISCLSGNFENTDCLAEELLLWSNGGPSACIFNSEVGCVKNENALAYSGEYIERLFYEIFVNETSNLGKINQFSKYHFVNLSYDDPNYRWVIYETNLLGDPETPVFEKRTNITTPIIYVDDDAVPPYDGSLEHPYRYIQDGINNADNEDNVNVKIGTYNENIIINKTIKLIGESKYSTIIDGGDIENTVIIQSNSSTITNFTILHNNSDKNKKEFIGLFIHKDCWGNTISNNIIIKNNKYGIYINDSCRNIISNNIITLNGMGIYLTKNITSRFEKQIILTCSNKIEYNNISSNEGYGIYIQNLLNNHIYNNNFINNSRGSGRDAYYFMSRNNVWNGNYWNEPRTEPKIIWGRFGPIYLFIPYIRNGIIFTTFKYLKIINTKFPIPAFDKNPAQKPYEIN
ncbi:MAG: C25 family cysteine peptidase [Candidatus Thermoplasmatota archaeon]|nr:C25 family cysteine peptidase [Candidatus Thermoplasmatota archaeon]